MTDPAGYGLGRSIERIEGLEKVMGTAKFILDTCEPGMLYARMVTSPHAHARIVSICASEAEMMPGVQAVLTGASSSIMCGTLLADRPVIAADKVRYHGEPVAVVVAASELEAMRAAEKIQVEYEPLPVVNSPTEGMKPGRIAR
ncbi:MAG TPA: hypothetical protein PLM74_06170 [Bacillota bacterium]|jgi:CO/xanthine dehydrogenase Mo-binding subunit|nr:hypothetical protein [Bacillota bacterium]